MATTFKGKRYRDNDEPTRTITVLTEPRNGEIQVRPNRFDTYWMPVEALDLHYTEEKEN